MSTTAIEKVTKQVGMIKLSIGGNKPVKDYFSDPCLIEHRAPEVDELSDFSGKKLLTESSVFVFETTKTKISIIQMLESIFCQKNEQVDIATYLLAGEHIMTVPEIEQLAMVAAAGEESYLRIDGTSNFFFTENASGSVAVVDLFHFKNEKEPKPPRRWRVLVNNIDNPHLWNATNRLFIKK